MILPMATSVAAVSIVFSQLFGRDFGIINWLLGGVGVRPDRVAGDQVVVLVGRSRRW